MRTSSKKPKLLVANRSEIACRIFQAAREMNIPTVGLYAPGDEEARHLTYADQIFQVPSYLDIFAIVDGALRLGVTMVHPGYGFLSERAPFPRAVEAAGMTFLGPRSETMEAMGGKIAAKELAERLGIPTIPWGKVEAGGDLRTAAKKVGFPLLLKAAAGGGGKGMRRVNKVEELEEAAESAKLEAEASFGDGTLFLERFLERPRHIEVQVFGDGTGEGAHLFERDCSLQRRHQKVWEETRAPNLATETLNGLFASSLKLVTEMKYRSAGTVEYLVDASGEYFFIEMNTRLQVEHPVTEQVTGIDLVTGQIALGLNPEGGMPFTVPSETRGHSIEVRLYAEDPAQGFMPCPGKIESIRWPTGTGIRIESGIESGQTITMNFDSMLGKLIVTAPTRAHALQRMRFALEETMLQGIGSNQSYLWAIANLPEVIEGRMHTGLLAEKLDEFRPLPDEGALALMAWMRDGKMESDIGRSSGALAPGVSDGAPTPWQTIRGFQP